MHTDTTGHAASGADTPPPRTAEEQRAQTGRPNRNLALILLGGALVMLAAAFGVALLVINAPF